MSGSVPCCKNLSFNSIKLRLISSTTTYLYSLSKSYVKNLLVMGLTGLAFSWFSKSKISWIEKPLILNLIWVTNSSISVSFAHSTSLLSGLQWLILKSKLSYPYSPVLNLKSSVWLKQKLKLFVFLTAS